MYSWTGSCCQQWSNRLYFDSFVLHPGVAHTRPSP
jgi:hypothetical protein